MTPQVGDGHGSRIHASAPARLRGTTDQPVAGEDLTDLADQIIRAERLREADGS